MDHRTTKYRQEKKSKYWKKEGDSNYTSKEFEEQFGSATNYAKFLNRQKSLQADNFGQKRNELV